MTEFSKYLSRVVKRRGLKCVQAAEICGIDTSVMFRWLNGRVLPTSWDRLEQAAKKLRLSPDEMDGLKKAYRKEVLGEEQSKSFDEILKMIQSLGEEKKNNGDCAKQIFFAYETHLQHITGGKDFLKLDNKTDVWMCIQNVLAAASAQRNGRLFVKLNHLPEMLFLQLKQFCSRMPDGKFEILISGSSIEDVKQNKIKWLGRMAALLLLGSENKISCYYVWNAQDAMKQNWMVLDDIFLQFSEDMSQGMIARDTEWASFFRESFEEMKERCQAIKRKEAGFVKSLKEEKPDNPEKIAFLQYMPYGSIAMAEKMISGNHSGNVKQGIWADDLAGDGVRKDTENVQYISCFTKEGLAEYLQTGKSAGFPDRPVCSLDRHLRYQALSHIISLAEQETAVHYIMLRENTLDMKGICVKCDSGANVSLCLGICLQGGKWEEIVISDADLWQEFGRFFACLPQSGLAYGEKETLEIMKKMVEGAVT